MGKVLGENPAGSCVRALTGVISIRLQPIELQLCADFKLSGLARRKKLQWIKITKSHAGNSRAHADAATGAGFCRVSAWWESLWSVIYSARCTRYTRAATVRTFPFRLGSGEGERLDLVALCSLDFPKKSQRIFFRLTVDDFYVSYYFVSFIHWYLFFSIENFWDLFWDKYFKVEPCRIAKIWSLRLKKTHP